jgi:hypothetical protein
MAALLQKTRLIHNQTPGPVAKSFERIAANLIAQGLRIPMAAPQKRLHPPGSLQARLLGHQPARLALNTRKQAVQKGATGFTQLPAPENRTKPRLPR